MKIQPTLNKYKIRIPLFMFPWTAGLLSGITCCMLKILAEMVMGNGLLQSICHPLFYICVFMVGINSYL